MPVAPLRQRPTPLSFVLFFCRKLAFPVLPQRVVIVVESAVTFFTSVLLLPHLIVVLPVPLVQQGHVVAHADQGVPQQLQLRRVDLGGDGAVAVPGQADIGAKNLSQITFNLIS